LRHQNTGILILITILKNGTLLTPREEFPGEPLVFQDGRIQSVGFPADRSLPPADQEFDVTDFWVTPGLIDIHTHGADGFDTMDANKEALQGISAFLAQRGVTSFLPTTLTAQTKQIQAAIDTIDQFASELKGARVMGIHLEGPYLNPDYKGAQPADLIRAANPSEYQPWLEHPKVKLMTLAPEVDGAMALIQAGQEVEMEFAVGHSGASYELMLAAADQGLRQATHTFNGMQGLHHRRPGTVGAVLMDERIFTQVISDGVHLHPAMVELILRIKGTEKTILISDSMRATGLSDGEYDLGGQRVLVEQSIARIPSGSLAGSTLTLDTAVKNTMAFCSLPFREVLPMATSVPAKAMGWQDQIGELKPGTQADVICFDADLTPRMVFIGGELIVDNL
jgi:N-acetylglucosamine-6-phosphate deacetylase